MLRIGLTGGIGSGKSTVAALLVERGAVLVDADRIAREVVAPGTPGLAAVAEAFGDDVLADDGALDRPALAAIVFADPQARARLDAIVHPLVRARAAELVAAAPADAIVVNDVPLLVETGQAGSYDLVVVVEAELETRVARLVRRGLTVDDARARIAAQATDEQRRAVADVVLDNSGTPEELAALVFGDPAARARLDAVVHPLVRARAAELVAAAPADAVVVQDVPLLVETGQAGSYDLVLVVETDPGTRVARLVDRGLTADDARARIASQATDEQRRAVADVVLRNDGDRDALAAQVDAFWAERVAPAVG